MAILANPLCMLVDIDTTLEAIAGRLYVIKNTSANARVITFGANTRTLSPQHTLLIGYDGFEWYDCYIGLVDLLTAQTVAGTKTFSSELRASASGNKIRLQGSNYGVILRHDDSSFYILLTAAEDPTGTYNALRPFAINLSTGAVTMSELVNITTGELRIPTAAPVTPADGHIWIA